MTEGAKASVTLSRLKGGERTWSITVVDGTTQAEVDGLIALAETNAARLTPPKPAPTEAAPTEAMIRLRGDIARWLLENGPAWPADVATAIGASRAVVANRMRAMADRGDLAKSREGYAVAVLRASP
jgi:hypothetical protein